MQYWVAKPQKRANDHKKNKNFLNSPSPNLLEVSLPSRAFVALHAQPKNCRATQAKSGFVLCQLDFLIIFCITIFVYFSVVAVNFISKNCFFQ